jgi:2-haloacid dehalogenase
MQQIKNIIFDLGGVLIDWNPEYLYRKLILDEKTRSSFFSTICTAEWNEEQDGGRLIADATSSLIEQFPDHADLIMAFYNRWEEMLGGPIQETVSIFKSLKEEDKYQFFALTNWSAETFPIALERYDFLHWFNGRLVSGEEHTRKPFADFYQLLLDRFNLKPEESIFIDDNLRNIKAAQAMGIYSIHFISPAQLITDLKRLDLLTSAVDRPIN